MFHTERNSPHTPLLLPLLGLKSADFIMVSKCQHFELTPNVILPPFGMYGKHFASMYEGSMVGAGSHVFAVMGYVIAKQVPDKKVGSQVELNPKLLAFVIGESEKRIGEAIKYLCAPDPRTRTKGDDGRRLVKLGEYAYQVVNGAKYRAIRDEETRRQQNRDAKRREREKKGKPLPGEQAAVSAMKRGDNGAADAITAQALPEANNEL